MTVEPRAELRGRGWSLSMQRWRSAPEPGLSSNLGAAPLVIISRRGRARRVGVRLAEGERLWVSVTAPVDMEVSGTLADGRALIDEQIEDPHGGAVVHRLARITGEAGEGFGRDDLPILRGFDAKGHGLTLMLGNHIQIWICLVDARDFDAAFGPLPPNDAEPAVYAGWRLP